MTDREKLIAIMAQGCRKSTEADGIPCCTESFCKDNQKSCHGSAADHLIANGVVVREKGEWEATYHTYYNRDGACQIADEFHCSKSALDG